MASFTLLYENKKKKKIYSMTSFTFFFFLKVLKSNEYLKLYIYI